MAEWWQAFQRPSAPPKGAGTAAPVVLNPIQQRAQQVLDFLMGGLLGAGDEEVRRRDPAAWGELVMAAAPFMGAIKATKGSGVKAAAEAVEDALLHGTSAEFSSFRPGPHGAIYLSAPEAGRKTQAEHIAGGPFGGRMVTAKLKPTVKKFDPYNDPQARAIAEAVRENVRGHWQGLVPHYVDMPELVKAAEPYGYNVFTVYEPAVQGRSIAVTDPALLDVIENVPYADWTAKAKR